MQPTTTTELLQSDMPIRSYMIESELYKYELFLKISQL